MNHLLFHISLCFLLFYQGAVAPQKTLVSSLCRLVTYDAGACLRSLTPSCASKSFFKSDFYDN